MLNLIDNLINILQHFQSLKKVRPLDANSLTDQFQEIHDFERPLAFMTADILVAGMIKARQDIDRGVRRRFELLFMQILAKFRQSGERVTHISCPRLFQIDEFELWNGGKDGAHRIGDAGRARVFVQRDAPAHDLQRLDARDPELFLLDVGRLAPGA